MMPFMGLYEEQLWIVPKEPLETLLDSEVVFPGKFMGSGTYYTPLELTQEDILAGCRAVEFAEVEQRYDIRLQVLLASG